MSWSVLQWVLSALGSLALAFVGFGWRVAAADRRGLRGLLNKARKDRDGLRDLIAGIRADIVALDKTVASVQQAQESDARVLAETLQRIRLELENTLLRGRE